MERNAIVYKKPHGEKDEDILVAENWSEVIFPEILQKYKAEDGTVLHSTTQHWWQRKAM